MFKPIMDFAGSLAAPLTARLNISSYNVNPRTGRIRRTRSKRPQPKLEGSPALPAGTAFFWIKGTTLKGDNKKLPGATVAAYAVAADGNSYQNLNRQVVSGADGAFSLAIPESVEKVLLVCSAPGVLTEQIECNKSDDNSDVKVKLLKAAN